MDNHLKIGEQNKKKSMSWTLATKLKCPCSTFYYIKSNTLLKSMTHFFRSLNDKEFLEKYIVHQFHEKPFQNRRTK